MPILKSGPRKRTATTSKTRLAAMIEEATVDAHDEDEQAVGLFTMLEEHLALPFETKIFGVSVTVEKLDLAVRNQIVAICRHGRERRRMHLADLPIPSPAPAGAEWIEAYRQWVQDG